MTAAAFATISPTIGQQFSKLIDVSVVFSLTSYVYSAIALIRLRPMDAPGAVRDRVMAVLAGLFSIWVIAASDATLLLVGTAILASSIPLYPFYKGRRSIMPIVVGQEA
jgi:hypothetical protein